MPLLLLGLLLLIRLRLAIVIHVDIDVDTLEVKNAEVLVVDRLLLIVLFRRVPLLPVRIRRHLPVTVRKGLLLSAVGVAMAARVTDERAVACDVVVLQPGIGP